MVTSSDERYTKTTLSRMVKVIKNEWTVHNTTKIERGSNEIYKITIETTSDTQPNIIKVNTHSGSDLSAEARLLRLLDTETGIPVPRIVGVVDDHPHLPAPFFLMEYIEGDHLPADRNELPVDDLSEIAREIGRHLGDVHAVNAFERFGRIHAAQAREHDSERAAPPLARDHGLEIADPYENWEVCLAETAERLLDRHQKTRFSDLVPRIRTTVETLQECLTLSGPPAIARIDHGPENVLVDRGTSTITGLPDWGLARTTHPEYELACAEQGFCGTISVDENRRLRVRDALYDGYRETHELESDEEFGARRRLYTLVFEVACMSWVSDWIATNDATELERAHRTFVAELL